MATETLENLWPGLASYEDGTRYQFCGRDLETSSIYTNIHRNILLTLYGKTGIGKTSIINAGLFPLLRQNGYFPVSLRTNLDSRISVAVSIVHEIEDELTKAGGSFTNEGHKDFLSSDTLSEDYLWRYFNATTFFNGEGREIYPVIVLDQFEDLVRTSHAADDILYQINALLDESLVCPFRADSPRTNYRILLSIREDDLCYLEDSINSCNLVSLRNNRYRLRPLTLAGAEEVIQIGRYAMPADIDESKEVVKEIIKISTDEESLISSNMLSLACSQLYESGNGKITLQAVKEFSSNPFFDFYKNSMRGVSLRSKFLVEQKLVNNGRKDFMSKSEFERRVKKSDAQKLLKGKNRILQSFHVGHTEYVELIHDSLARTISGIAFNATEWLITLVTLFFLIPSLWIFTKGMLLSFSDQTSFLVSIFPLCSCLLVPLCLQLYHNEKLKLWVAVSASVAMLSSVLVFLSLGVPKELNNVALFLFPLLLCFAPVAFFYLPDAMNLESGGHKKFHINSSVYILVCLAFAELFICYRHYRFDDWNNSEILFLAISAICLVCAFKKSYLSYSILFYFYCLISILQGGNNRVSGLVFLAAAVFCHFQNESKNSRNVLKNKKKKLIIIECGIIFTYLVLSTGVLPSNFSTDNTVIYDIILFLLILFLNCFIFFFNDNSVYKGIHLVWPILFISLIAIMPLSTRTIYTLGHYVPEMISKDYGIIKIDDHSYECARVQPANYFLRGGFFKHSDERRFDNFEILKDNILKGHVATNLYFNSTNKQPMLEDVVSQAKFMVPFILNEKNDSVQYCFLPSLLPIKDSIRSAYGHSSSLEDSIKLSILFADEKILYDSFLNSSDSKGYDTTLKALKELDSMLIEKLNSLTDCLKTSSYSLETVVDIEKYSTVYLASAFCNEALLRDNIKALCFFCSLLQNIGMVEEPYYINKNYGYFQNMDVNVDINMDIKKKRTSHYSLKNYLDGVKEIQYYHEALSALSVFSFKLQCDMYNSLVTDEAKEISHIGKVKFTPFDRLIKSIAEYNYKDIEDLMTHVSNGLNTYSDSLECTEEQIKQIIEKTESIMKLTQDGIMEDSFISKLKFLTDFFRKLTELDTPYFGIFAENMALVTPILASETELQEVKKVTIQRTKDINEIIDKEIENKKTIRKTLQPILEQLSELVNELNQYRNMIPRAAN